MAGYKPRVSFPEELLEFRDQVFLDLGATDVGLFKNHNADFANKISYGYPNQKWNVRVQNLKNWCCGPWDFFFSSNY